jgi:hypothetical protein
MFDIKIHVILITYLNYLSSLDHSQIKYLIKSHGLHC